MVGHGTSWGSHGHRAVEGSHEPTGGAVRASSTGSGRGDRRSGRDLAGRVADECGARRSHQLRDRLEHGRRRTQPEPTGRRSSTNGQVTVSNDANFTGVARRAARRRIVGCRSGLAPQLPQLELRLGVRGRHHRSTIRTGSVTSRPSRSPTRTTSASPTSRTTSSRVALVRATSSPTSAFTRRVFKGDGNFHFILSKGPDPDIRVAGDIVIEAEYDNKGDVAERSGPRRGAIPAPRSARSSPSASTTPASRRRPSGISPKSRSTSPRSVSSPNVDDVDARRVASRSGSGVSFHARATATTRRSRTTGNRSGSTSTSAAGSSSRRRSPQRSRATRSSR